MFQMKRERRRRKRQKAEPINPEVAHKLYAFAKTKSAANIPEGAGFVRAPVIESDPAGTYDVKVEPTEEMLDALEVEHQQEVEDHERAEKNKSARALTGRKARVVNLSKNKLNGVLVELDFWDEKNQVFEVRLEQTKVMFKMDLKYLIPLDPEDEEKAEL